MNDLKTMQLYQKYNESQKDSDFQRGMIDGLLNRIAVSDNEDEVENAVKILIENYIPKYKEKAREAHKAFVEFNKHQGF